MCENVRKNPQSSVLRRLSQNMMIIVLRTFNLLTLYRTITTYKKPFENIVGKGENAGYQDFLLFSTMFSTIKKEVPTFHSHFILPSANVSNFDQS